MQNVLREIRGRAWRGVVASCLKNPSSLNTSQYILGRPVHPSEEEEEKFSSTVSSQLTLGQFVNQFVSQLLENYIHTFSEINLCCQIVTRMLCCTVTRLSYQLADWDAWPHPIYITNSIFAPLAVASSLLQMCVQPQRRTGTGYSDVQISLLHSRI